MSLIDDIRANTSNVRLAKLAMAQAIENKGSSVGNYTNVPTFSNIIKGINSIETGLKVNGTEDAVILAADDLIKGDVCSLTEAPTLGYEANRVTNLNATQTSIAPIVMDNGNFILCAKYSSYRMYFYPYYLVDGVYKPLTVDGVSTYIDSASGSSAEPDRSYDAEKKMFYVVDGTTAVKAYKIDVENLNMTLEKTYTGSFYLGGIATYCYKNNIFIQRQAGSSSSDYGTYIYYLNDADNTFKYVDALITGTDWDSIVNLASANTTHWACNFTIDLYGDLFVCLACKYGSNTNRFYIRKYTVDESTGYLVGSGNYVKITDARSNYYSYTTFFTTNPPFIYVAKSGSLALYVNNSTTLKGLWITETLGSSAATLEFSDGLNVAKVSRIYFSAADEYLFVLSTDTNYTTAQQTRLYKLIPSPDAIRFEFIGCPTEMFNPTVATGLMPIGNSYDFASQTIMKANDIGWYALYSVKKLTSNYDYIATNCKNIISSDDDVSAYGVAKDNILEGAIGEASVFLKT